MRNHVLESLENLKQNKIDVTTAGIVAKSAETIMSSLKLQLAYSSMIGDEPYIKFLHDSHDGKKQKKLEASK